MNNMEVFKWDFPEFKVQLDQARNLAVLWKKAQAQWSTYMYVTVYVP